MAEPGALASAAGSQNARVSFALPPLPYGLRELEPHLGEETLRIHHGRHHAKYVENLNRLLTDQDSGAASLEEVLRAANKAGQGALFNNAAQAWNHAFFWEGMTPQSSAPDEPLAHAITKAFGSAETLRERFIAEGVGHFGSGWVWIVARGSELMVISTHDAKTPVADDGLIPLLTCDVWEHAYYIEHRQDRAAWLAVWWDKLANWRLAERQYRAALGQGVAWSFPRDGG
jgi:Fe-Mn family superoxide dismutase